jgi:hypothetical protein
VPLTEELCGTGDPARGSALSSLTRPRRYPRESETSILGGAGCQLARPRYTPGQLASGAGRCVGRAHSTYRKAECRGTLWVPAGCHPVGHGPAGRPRGMKTSPLPRRPWNKRQAG